MCTLASRHILRNLAELAPGLPDGNCQASETLIGLVLRDNRESDTKLAGLPSRRVERVARDGEDTFRKGFGQGESLRVERRDVDEEEHPGDRRDLEWDERRDALVSAEHDTISETN